MRPVNRCQLNLSRDNEGWWRTCGEIAYVLDLEGTTGFAVIALIADVTEDLFHHRWIVAEEIPIVCGIVTIFLCKVVRLRVTHTIFVYQRVIVTA